MPDKGLNPKQPENLFTHVTSSKGICVLIAHGSGTVDVLSQHAWPELALQSLQGFVASYPSVSNVVASDIDSHAAALRAAARVLLEDEVDSRTGFALPGGLSVPSPHGAAPAGDGWRGCTGNSHSSPTSAAMADSWGRADDRRLMVCEVRVKRLQQPTARPGGPCATAAAAAPLQGTFVQPMVCEEPLQDASAAGGGCLPFRSACAVLAGRLGPEWWVVPLPPDVTHQAGLPLMCPDSRCLLRYVAYARVAPNPQQLLGASHLSAWRAQQHLGTRDPQSPASPAQQSRAFAGPHDSAAAAATPPYAPGPLARFEDGLDEPSAASAPSDSLDGAELGSAAAADAAVTAGAGAQLAAGIQTSAAEAAATIAAAATATEDRLEAATEAATDRLVAAVAAAEDKLLAAVAAAEGELGVAAAAAAAAADNLEAAAAAASAAEAKLEAVAVTAGSKLEAAAATAEDKLGDAAAAAAAAADKLGDAAAAAAAAEGRLETAAAAASDKLEAATAAAEDKLEAAASVAEDRLESAATTAIERLVAAAAAAEDKLLAAAAMARYNLGVAAAAAKYNLGTAAATAGYKFGAAAAGATAAEDKVGAAAATAEGKLGAAAAAAEDTLGAAAAVARYNLGAAAAAAKYKLGTAAATAGYKFGVAAVAATAAEERLTAATAAAAPADKPYGRSGGGEQAWGRGG